MIVRATLVTVEMLTVAGQLMTLIIVVLLVIWALVGPLMVIKGWWPVWTSSVTVNTTTVSLLVSVPSTVQAIQVPVTPAAVVLTYPVILAHVWVLLLVKAEPPVVRPLRQQPLPTALTIGTSSITFLSVAWLTSKAPWLCVPRFTTSLSLSWTIVVTTARGCLRICRGVSRQNHP